MTSHSCLSLLNLIPRVNCLAVKISSLITETLLWQKIVPSARTFVLIMHTGKMQLFSNGLAVVFEVFKMTAQYKRFQPCVPRKDFLRPGRTELVREWFGQRGCDILCCAVTDEQPDAKTNKLMWTKLVSFQACYAKKKGNDGFFRSTRNKFPTNAH